MRNRKLNRKSTFVCFIDAKKAFDCVNRDLLWYKLLQFGINGKFLDALKSLYEGTECAVKVNDHMTDFFRVRQGVKQGCKISPTIFAMYINDLASRYQCAWMWRYHRRRAASNSTLRRWYRIDCTGWSRIAENVGRCTRVVPKVANDGQQRQD